MPAELLQVRIIWDRRKVPLPHNDLNFHQLHVSPEPGHPFGRKGLQLAAAWQHLATATTAGLLTLDGDVVIDPLQLNLMYEAINKDPTVVWAAPVRLWPASTKRPEWIWSHLTGFPADQAQADDWEEHEGFLFSFCFTYLPRKLVQACIGAGLKQWAYPHCDEKCHQTASKLRVPIRVARMDPPVHLNY